MEYLKKNKTQFTLLFIIPVLFLYRMIFFSEIVVTNDELERHPINEWRDNYLSNNDQIPQWFPNLFSGMPSYGGYIYSNGDPTKILRNNILFNPGLKVWFYLSLSGIGMFVLLRFLDVSKFSALFGGLISALTPYSFGLINAGHLNKIFSMAYIPWVLLAAIFCMKRPTIRSILLLALATALQLWVNHPQIAYYTWMVIGFYYVWSVGLKIKNNTLSIKTFILPLAGLITGIVLALFLVSDPYLEIYKFQKYSNRGAKSVLNNSDQTKSGTDWDYATNWSFHPLEGLSFFYPYHYGLQNKSIPINDIDDLVDYKKYWGYMPFTQSTHYVGLITILFAILGVLLRKPDKIELVFWVITTLALITGFGSFFPLLYKPFYSILPYFSKFRIPSMIYILLAITFPILGAKGLDTFFNRINEKDTFKKVLYIAGGMMGLTFILLMFGEILFSFSSPEKDGRLLQQYGIQVIEKLKSSRVDIFNKGLLINFALSLGFLGLIWGLIAKKLDKNIFKYGILLLAVLDLWIINQEFMNVKPSKNMDKIFKNDSVINYIQNDNGHYRVFPADQIGSNRYSYWNIESIVGYRPVKLRHYQDLMDAGGFTKRKILNMLNVKYVLTNKKINNSNFLIIDGLNGIYENKNVLPKSWIVGSIKSVNSQKESLMEILSNHFSPTKQAIIVNYKGSKIPDNATGKVIVKSRTENKIELDSFSQTGGLLVLSEIYYEPGWKATINGQETPIYQTNHVLRSVVVPSGESKVVFEYDTTDWKRARILSRISFFSILLIIGSLFWQDRKKIR